MSKSLETVYGETLMTTQLSPVRFTINGLPQSLHILRAHRRWENRVCASALPKAKPWEFPVTRGDVLYLFLEDSYSRIQKRPLNITGDAPDNLMLEKLRNGLEQQIERFLGSIPTQFSLLATLQRIRSVVSDVNPYANDYRDLCILK
ncbi:hypothetical protein [Sporomusa aerivorans]|uniref:hypothetical protein n=1 Tax=Sporomusa aerivorans TaxID=204936 RepID=UPI00352A826F